MFTNLFSFIIFFFVFTFIINVYTKISAILDLLLCMMEKVLLLIDDFLTTFCTGYWYYACLNLKGYVAWLEILVNLLKP